MSSDSNVSVSDVSGRVKKPLSQAQKDALQRAAEQRQNLLATFLHAVQTGDWAPLANEFGKVRASLEKRQRAEDRLATQEFRNPRKARRTIPAYVSEPDNTIPYYIRVAPESFKDGWEFTPGFKLAVPDAGLAVNEDFTFQLHGASIVCDPFKLKDWLLNGTGPHDNQTLRGMGYPANLADALKNLKFPFGAVLVYVPHVFLTDVYATKALWRLDEFNRGCRDEHNSEQNQMLWNVVERKMRINRIMVD